MTVLDHKVEIEQTKMTYLEVLIETKLKKVQIKHKPGNIKRNISVSNIINSAEIPYCFEKTLHMYGHNFL